MDDLHAERLRVLKMMEEGKVSAEECAELLEALDVPAPPPPRRKGMTPARVWAAVGAGLVFVGFLLPWFWIGQLQGGYLCGGDMPHAMGWIILVFALAAVMIPKWRPGVFLLILGLAILGFLAFNFHGHLVLGPWVVCLGYLIELTSLLNERLHVEGIVAD